MIRSTRVFIPVHDVQPTQNSQRRYRVGVAQLSNAHSVLVETWAPDASSAHAEVSRLWLYLTSHTEYEWDTEVAETTPGIYSGDDWYRVVLMAKGFWSEERCQNEAARLGTLAHEWAVSHYTQEERHRHTLPFSPTAQTLVVCSHCSDIVSVMATWRRCSCRRVMARYLDGPGTVTVRAPYGTQYSVLELAYRELDNLASGSVVRARCEGKYEARPDMGETE